MDVEIGIADDTATIAIGKIKNLSNCNMTCVSTDLLQKALTLMKRDMKREYVYIMVDDVSNEPLLMTGDKDNDTGILISPYTPQKK